MNKIFKNLMCRKEKDQIDFFQLQRKHYGFSNADKILYYINETDCTLGFFAMYRCWLEYLYFAHICGFVPVIEVGADFAYAEDKKIAGTKNSFEYYFQQPSSISVQEAMHSRRVVRSDVIHRQMVELVLTGKMFHYDCNLRYMYLMAEVIRDYLKFNCETQDYINTGMKKLGIGKIKMLGVHVRGTDFKKKYDNHPVFVTETDVFRVIDDIFEKKNYEKIFVATDDQLIQKTFERRYGDKLCFYSDVLRSSDMRSVAFHKSDRKNHKYRLGLEVIRDMYTLSQCDGFVAGISQVAVCARINKLARKEKYQDLVIIDKGINRNGRKFYQHESANKKKF